MKTIAFQDRAGGSIREYFDRADPLQKRQDRIKAALEDLRHFAMIRVYLVNGRKLRLLFVKGY